jgi:alcohol dehydrogenase class IV
MFKYRFEGTAIPKTIISGLGSRSEISTEVGRLGLHRIVLICSGSLKANTPFIAEIAAALSDRLVDVIDRIEANTPVVAVNRVVERVRPLRPDGVVSVGGGAVHDLAKAVAVMIPSGRSITDFVSRFEPPATFHAADVDVDPLPVLTLPTTFSAADVVGGGAVTDTVRGEKLIFVHPKLTPSCVFLDGELVASTPRRILAASGMNAVHHCLEAYYSRGAQPVTDALALGALRGLLDRLPSLAPDHASPEPECYQMALEYASMSGLTYANSWLGIGHSVCHSLGGRYGLSHGQANSVMVLHSLKFNFEAALPRIADAARRCGISASGDDRKAAAALVDAVDLLSARLGTPRSLSAIGLPAGQFDQIADDVLADPQTYWNPRRADKAEIIAWLESAWS